MAEAWVLWHMYGDGSGAHVARVYLDEARAKQDYELLERSGGEWKLDKVPVFPPT